MQLFRVLLLASFAVWFGGFGFYTAIVVPIGTEVLGSARRQGFVTQLVTNQLNIFCAIAVVMMLLESMLGWRNSHRLMRRFQLGTSLVILLALVALFFLHRLMDRHLDPASGSIDDASAFYSLHRYYLWTSTIQWIAAWLWLVLLVRSWLAAFRIVPSQNAINNSEVPVSNELGST